MTALTYTGNVGSGDKIRVNEMHRELHIMCTTFMHEFVVGIQLTARSVWVPARIEGAGINSTNAFIFDMVTNVSHVFRFSLNDSAICLVSQVDQRNTLVHSVNANTQKITGN